jgi:hypothetical protein
MLGIFKNPPTIRLDEWQTVDLRADATADLPCPWCFAPTRESDAECPSCQRRFG